MRKMKSFTVSAPYQDLLGKQGIEKEEIIKEIFVNDFKVVVISKEVRYEKGAKSQEWYFEIFSKNEYLPDWWMFNTLFAEWTKKEMLKTLAQFEKYGLSMNI